MLGRALARLAAALADAPTRSTRAEAGRAPSADDFAVGVGEDSESRGTISSSSVPVAVTPTMPCAPCALGVPYASSASSASGFLAVAGVEGAADTFSFSLRAPTAAAVFFVAVDDFDLVAFVAFVAFALRIDTSDRSSERDNRSATPGHRFGVDGGSHGVAAHSSSISVVGSKHGSGAETSLLVLPPTTAWGGALHDDFGRFVSLGHKVDERLKELAAEIDLVPGLLFHPRAREPLTRGAHAPLYSSAEDEEASDYAMRAPYPTIHLLRSSDLKALPPAAAARVVPRNKRTLSSLGVAVLREKFGALRADAGDHAGDSSQTERIRE